MTTIEESNIAVIKKAVQAVNDGTMAQVAASIIAPDFRRHDLAAALPNAAGPGGLSDFIEMVRSAPPDFRMEIVDIFGTGDRAAMRWVREKLERSWNKLSLPVQTLIRERYEAVLQVLAAKSVIEAD